MSHATMNADMRRCMEECENCHHLCMETIAHCLELAGEHAEASHIRLLLDCVEICQTSSHFLMRDSDVHGFTCAACAEVCERCARDCERFDNDFMKQCAEACRRCAESCRQMAKMAKVAA